MFKTLKSSFLYSVEMHRTKKQERTAVRTRNKTVTKRNSYKGGLQWYVLQISTIDDILMDVGERQRKEDRGREQPKWKTKYKADCK